MNSTGICRIPLINSKGSIRIIRCPLKIHINLLELRSSSLGIHRMLLRIFRFLFRRQIGIDIYSRLHGTSTRNFENIAQNSEDFKNSQVCDGNSQKFLRTFQTTKFCCNLFRILKVLPEILKIQLEMYSNPLEIYRPRQKSQKFTQHFAQRPQKMNIHPGIDTYQHT